MKTIIFVEPLFYGVYLVEAAKKMNHQVIAVVSNPDNPVLFGYEEYYDDIILAETKDADSIYHAITESNYYNDFDALIPATDYVTAATAEAAQMLKIKGTPLFAALCARNKDMAKEVFVHNNIPCAAYCKVSNIEEARSGANAIGYPIVLKPSNACGSQNVFFATCDEELEKAFRKISAFNCSYLDYKINQEYLLEEFLDGPGFSVELFLVHGEIEFAEVTEKITSALPYFVELIHVFPASIMQDKQEEIIKIGFNAVKSIGFTDGPTHVELKYTKKGPKIIEINGRPGGDNISSDLVFNAYGINIYKEMVSLYLDEDIHICKTRNQASSIGYISADKRGKLKKIEGIDLLVQHKNVNRYEIEAKPSANIDIPKESDDRLGYFIVTTKDSKNAKETVQDLLKKIEIIYE